MTAPEALIPEALPLPADNPFAARWDTPFGLPPFAAIQPAHIQPAFEAALAKHKDEMAAIVADPAAPDFANTIEALELAGRALSHTNEALQAIERALSPLTSRHWSAIMMDEGLFARVDAVFAKREALGLGSEQLRLLERTHRGFIRSGAQLGAEDKARLAAINERLAGLGTQFSQNVLKDESSYALMIEDEAGLAGLPPFLLAAMARAAADRGHPGQHAVTLSRSVIEPFLTFSTRRDLREEAFAAWGKRGENGNDSDNRAIVAEMVKLRAQKAKLLGYATRRRRMSASCSSWSGRRPRRARRRRPPISPRWRRPRARTARSAPRTGATTPRRSARRPMRSMRPC